MNKTVAAVILAVVLALGGGYFVSKQSSKDKASNQSSPSDTSKSMGSGTTLDLSNHQLTELPDSVLGRTDITILNLSNNQLASLPAGISKLRNLEVLNVENNRLESFPPEISQLTKLREIHANNNRLTNLPAELDTMTYLKILDISGNNNIPMSRLDQLKTKLPNAQIKT